MFVYFILKIVHDDLQKTDKIFEPEIGDQQREREE